MENIKTIFDFIAYQEMLKLLPLDEYMEKMEELSKLGGNK